LQWDKRYQNPLVEAEKQNKWKDVRLSCKVRNMSFMPFFFSGHVLTLLLPLPELGPSTIQFSKSHERRMKRKAKEQLTGNMDDLQIALASLDEDIAEPPPPGSLEKPSSESNSKHSQELKPKAGSNIGKIGKGSSSTLSKAQRKRVL
jgi:hypothetical protein